MLRKSPSKTPSARARSPAREGFFNVMVYSCPYSFAVRVSERSVGGFAGADAHGVFEIEDKDFSVADLAGLGGAGDGADDLVDLAGRDRHFDLDLRQKAHGVFSAAVNLGVAFLTPVALDLGNGQSLHAD